MISPDAPRWWPAEDGRPIRNDYYQATDHEIVDYRLWRGGGQDLSIRGPQPAGGETPDVVCLGSAHTFGRFVAEPFPALRGPRADLSVLNGGLAGGQPRDFLDAAPTLLEMASRCRAVVLQVMSARAVPNAALRQVGADDMDSIADWYRERLAVEEFAEVAEAVRESREEWVEDTLELIGAVGRPVVLLWFSRREPSYQLGFRRLRDVFGGFPQLVDERMIERIRAGADRFVEVVTSVGLPHSLRSRSDGAQVTVVRPDGTPRSEISYYPSPEMHQEVAERLLLEAGDLLGVTS